MANIPNSSRYRSASNRASANDGAAGRTWSEHIHNNPHDSNADPSANMNWLWVVVALCLLIAFPYHVLGAVGLAVTICWFFSKK